MRIDPEDRILGFPALDMRELMRRRVFDAQTAGKVMKIDPAAAAHLIEQLAAEDYICPSEKVQAQSGLAWQTTPKGTKLANAGTLPSITREQADRIMEEFMARVKRCADSDDFHVEVADVVLFGSYLTEAPEVNDIDLIVRLRVKESFKTKSYDEALRSKLATLVASGRTFPDARAWLAFLQTEVVQYLQGVSPYLAFHRSDALQLIEMADRKQNLPNPGTPHKTIYTAPPLARPRPA